MFKIYCSYGEIVDKITILELKKLHAPENKSIQNEYELLAPYKKHDASFHELYMELYTINQTLWDCEDKIRQKRQIQRIRRRVYFHRGKYTCPKMTKDID